MSESDTTTTLRLRRVRFKSGGELRVLHQNTPKKDKRVQDAVSWFAAAAQEGCEDFPAAVPVMFAAVLVYSTGHVLVKYENLENSGIPAGYVPQYVKDLLLAEFSIINSTD